MKIVILTGAGVSAESGLKTFRDNNGLWENHSIYEVATPEAFSSNPKLVYQFYNQRRQQLVSDEVTVNEAHKALARLEHNFLGEVLLITQNVDDLHERAGSKNIIHMHGELLKMRCVKTNSVFDIQADLNGDTICDCCHEKGNLRPHIVWFGEDVPSMSIIPHHLQEAEIFVSIGTSAQVYPAAQFVQMVRSECRTVEINLERTQASSFFDEGYYGLASIEVPKFLNNLINIVNEKSKA